MSAQLLTTDEAAELLRLTINRLCRLVRRGLIPHVQLPGNDVRFDAADLAAWVESRKSAFDAEAEAASR
jgi:excisionase family DNA binding protein